ncbi:hypothetical protein GALMADRAFT_232834 [Galerina marginata CBS 339.88]|uniref:Secreted protein n=1 Tax=Galerina marginata (strain CBS 339.88) TaxID=685588 RepID=A0A067S4R8_GALM3|nr:hypothetical protein GALMADRAFT_232834 [Galerina marginata CBS 339.88]
MSHKSRRAWLFVLLLLWYSGRELFQACTSLLFTGTRLRITSSFDSESEPRHVRLRLGFASYGPNHGAFPEAFFDRHPRL